MLAQNFKSAAELGLADASLRALQQVLAILERKEVAYREPAKEFEGYAEAGAPLQFFNMAAYRNSEDCGTVLCIKGAAEVVAGVGVYDGDGIREFWGHTEYPRAVRELFFPMGARSVSVEQAATALRNFLTHGEARWAEALAG